MPEAFAVLLIIVVAVAAWIGAWLHARNPTNYNVRAEIDRLGQYANWLEQRLEVARRENWDDDMIAGITDELAATQQELVRTRGRR